jgi:hypothetical protein
MDAYRPVRFPPWWAMPYTPWWAISTLRPSLPPVRSSKPVSDDITPSESTAATDVIVASESLTAPQKAVEDAAGSARGVTMQIDIAVWRRRWFWRLAVKAAVGFFRP